jgi:hypothetical protein
MTQPNPSANVYLAPSLPIGGAVSIDFIRNSAGYLLISTTSGPVSYVQQAPWVGNMIFTAALTGGISVPLPINPPDGFIFAVCNGTSSVFTHGHRIFWRA